MRNEKKLKNGKLVAIKEKNSPKKKKYFFRDLLSFLFAMIAFGALFYPIIANYLVSNQTQTIVTKFNNRTSQLSVKEIKKQLAEAKKYNTYIYDMSQKIAYKKAKPNYSKALDIDSTGMMGYLSIPQISLKNVPIYHGDSEATLAIGIGHLPQTSLPIGGKNTHTVLSAHSGRANSTLFTDLDRLKIGDVFYITTLNLKMKYEIRSIKVVLPSDVSSLGIKKGKDEATLVTCYPTGINTHRLLVTGERIPYNQKTKTEGIQRNKYGYNFWVMTLSSLLAAFGLLFLIHKIMKKYKKNKSRDQEGEILNL